MQLTIKGKIYQLKFGIGATRPVVVHYGYNKPSDYKKIVEDLGIKEMKEPSFEQLDFLALLVLSAIQSAMKPSIVELTQEDVLEHICEHPEEFEKLVVEFKQSQVQPEANPKSRGK